MAVTRYLLAMHKHCLILASIVLFTACKHDDPKPAPPPPAAPPAKTTQADAPVPKPAEAPPTKVPEAPPKKPAEPTPPVSTEKPAAPATVDMDADIKALMAKPEQPDTSIEVQHILIAFKGAPRMTSITRSKDEAKALAEKVYAEAVGGADFGELVKKHTNDSAPGIYPMTKAGRAGMVKSFGDVGFRLKVGEIGVAPWDASASPFGWHIMKRLK